MSRELSRVTRYADDRIIAPAAPRPVQTPSPAGGIHVQSFADAGQIPAAFDGPALWAEIHKRALVEKGNDSEFIKRIESRLPCSTCKPHWQTFLRRFPPVWGEGYFAWTVKAHNDVNLRLGKRTMDEATARALWTRPKDAGGS